MYLRIGRTHTYARPYPSKPVRAFPSKASGSSSEGIAVDSGLLEPRMSVHQDQIWSVGVLV